MSRYLSQINEIIAKHVNCLEHALIYGENVDRGSYLSGLSRNLTASETRRIVNVGNCEYTHCGVGFGAMMGGVNAVLFVKQLDFMLLGIDHFVSTYHSIRASHIPNLGSFTIVTAVYDQGFQGPQSSFNSLQDICSMARVSGFTLTNHADASAVAAQEISAPGFRIIGLSQRCANEEIFVPDSVEKSSDCSTFRYQSGNDVSIVCANFSLTCGLELAKALGEKGVSASLLNVNPVYNPDWSLLLADTARTGKVLVLDDTKGMNGLGSLVAQTIQQNQDRAVVRLVKRPQHIPFGVSLEAFEMPSAAAVIRDLGLRAVESESPSSGKGA